MLSTQRHMLTFPPFLSFLSPPFLPLFKNKHTNKQTNTHIPRPHRPHFKRKKKTSGYYSPKEFGLTLFLKEAVENNFFLQSYFLKKQQRTNKT